MYLNLHLRGRPFITHIHTKLLLTVKDNKARQYDLVRWKRELSKIEKGNHLRGWLNMEGLRILYVFSNADVALADWVPSTRYGALDSTKGVWGKSLCRGNIELPLSFPPPCPKVYLERADGDPLWEANVSPGSSNILPLQRSTISRFQLFTHFVKFQLFLLQGLWAAFVYSSPQCTLHTIHFYNTT